MLCAHRSTIDSLGARSPCGQSPLVKAPRTQRAAARGSAPYRAEGDQLRGEGRAGCYHFSELAQRVLAVAALLLDEHRVQLARLLGHANVRPLPLARGVAKRRGANKEASLRPKAAAEAAQLLHRAHEVPLLALLRKQPRRQHHVRPACSAAGL